MFIRVSCQRGVVGLDVQLEVTLQPIMLKEAYNAHGIYLNTQRRYDTRDIKQRIHLITRESPHRSRTGVCTAPSAWAR